MVVAVVLFGVVAFLSMILSALLIRRQGVLTTECGVLFDDRSDLIDQHEELIDQVEALSLKKSRR